MTKHLALLLCIGLAFWSCKDAEEPKPNGTVNITIGTPGNVYLDDWWDYASKYEIYINNKLEKESSFNNFENTSIGTEIGVHTVLCVISDAFSVWL